MNYVEPDTPPTELAPVEGCFPVWGCTVKVMEDNLLAVLTAENAELRARVAALEARPEPGFTYGEHGAVYAPIGENGSPVLIAIGAHRVAELEGRETLSYPAWAYESMAAYAAQFTGLDKAAPDPRSEILARAMRNGE